MTPEKAMNFNKKALEKLKPSPDGKRYSIRDTATRGLIVRVGQSGKKTFCLYRKIEGRTVRKALGVFPDMSIENARGKVGGLNEKVSKGEEIKPSQASATMTLKELFDIYLERHAKRYKKSWRYDDQNYGKHLSRWNDRRISSIRRPEVIELHAAIGEESGKVPANRCLALLRKMFNFAIDLELDIANPCSRVKMFKEKSRARFLGSEESDNVEKFWDVLINWPETLYRDFFLLCLFTGARKMNLQTMEWSEVNLERAVWTIPGDKAKSGEDTHVPLVPDAAAILKDRKSKATGPWVFPGQGDHVREVRTAWKAICAAAGIEAVGSSGLHIHDLRRSMGSYAKMSGSSLPMLQSILGHIDGSSVKVYAHTTQDPVRQAMQEAVNLMLTVGKVERKEADVMEVGGKE